MGPQVSVLPVTCHKIIETVSDAKRILAECLNGDLNLVSRGPDDREAAQFIQNNAVFVFEEFGDWLNPREWFDEASEPEFSISAVPNVALMRKSIKITTNGRRYLVMVIYQSQDLAHQVTQPVQNTQHGSYNRTLSWPSQLARPEIIPSSTAIAGSWAAALEKEIRAKGDKKENDK
ncbi:putative camp independent regulatory protein [Fusarium austroafricanum]|uniref:Putative camp independent regulatory protein n=1 Tax=Fusarium austroafricanum TaxID=2364996 RepID=A0A8H4NHS2_9HYPO|nr:putative camp independent regulatory protein [Fusarium austroafricanum]